MSEEIIKPLSVDVVEGVDENGEYIEHTITFKYPDMSDDDKCVFEFDLLGGLYEYTLPKVKKINGVIEIEID